MVWTREVIRATLLIELNISQHKKKNTQMMIAF